MDDELITLATRISKHLGGRQVACAESVTSGRLATTFAAVEEAESFLRGGLVAYQRGVKERLLDLTAETVLSCEAAEQMAIGVARLLDASVAVATTGLAGGEPQHGIEVGTVFIGITIDGVGSSSRHRFDGAPLEVCAATTRQALVELCDALREHVAFPA